MQNSGIINVDDPANQLTEDDLDQIQDVDMYDNQVQDETSEIIEETPFEPLEQEIQPDDDDSYLDEIQPDEDDIIEEEAIEQPIEEEPQDIKTKYNITEEDLKNAVGTSGDIQYCAYTVLMEFNLKREEILYVSKDEESVVVKLPSKNMAKEIKAAWNKELMRIGLMMYRVKVKTDGSYVIISVHPDHEITDASELD